MLWRIAWRNVWRNRKRSLIIMGAVSLGLWAGIFLMAFYNGMIEQRVNSAINSEVSHLQLHHPAFRQDYEPRYVLPGGIQMLEQIGNYAEVKAITGRIVLQGMVASAAGSAGIRINAIMPSSEDRITGLNSKLVSGKQLDSSRVHDMIASQRLMKKLKLKEGRKAIITFQDREGNLVSGAFKVTGVYSTNNAPFDESNVFVNLAGVDSMAGVRGQLHEIAVLLKNGNSLETIQAKLKQQYPQAEVLNWREIAPEISLTVEFGDQMVYIFMAIILLALAFGILNTMMMSVLERTRELGMLLALGMNRRRVFLMILLETCLLVFAACPPGVVLGLATTAITQHTGIDFSQYSEVYAEFGYSEILYPALNMQQFGNILAMVVLTAILSGLLPARRALRLKPAESIRKQ